MLHFIESKFKTMEQRVDCWEEMIGGADDDTVLDQKT